jgi:hypothetical protein
MRNPYRKNAGFKGGKFNPTTQDWVTIYSAEAQLLDPAGGKYVVVCEKHGTLCNFKSLKAAREHLDVVDFCEECCGK